MPVCFDVRYQNLVRNLGQNTLPPPDSIFHRLAQIYHSIRYLRQYKFGGMEENCTMNLKNCIGKLMIFSEKMEYH